LLFSCITYDWAHLIRTVRLEDPLLRPRCGGTMRIRADFEEDIEEQV
jgi:hypothetical protein